MITPTIHRYDSVGSTNDIALEMAKSGAPEGTVILAQSQSKGRGRRGRQWFDKPGQSILMSAILRPSIPLNRYSELAFTAAVAVAECIEAECGLVPSLKWPNDVLIRDKKLCGILIESAAGAAIVGIGVNVKQTEFPPELTVPPLPRRGLGGGSPGPTSLAIEGARCLDTDSLANALISRLFSISALDFEEILARWRKYMWGIGRPVEVATEDDTISGVITGIDSDGALLIDQNGETRRVIASVGISPADGPNHNS